MINHCYIYYVLIALLLQPALGLGQTVDADLRQHATKQQQQLINQYGLSQNLHATTVCNQLMTELELIAFESCQIIQAPFANAYSTANGELILTEGLLTALRNPDQLAHILAHEYAHLHLKHHRRAYDMVKDPPVFFTKSRIKKFYRQIESAADDWADQHLPLHGFDPLQINHYLIRITQTAPEKSNDHEPLSDRIKRHNLPKEVVAADWLKKLRDQASNE